MEIHQDLLYTTGNYTCYLVIAHKGKESEKEWAFQVSLAVKNPAANAGDTRDMGSIPWWGRSPGGGRGNPLQYSCMENLMDRGACWATVHGVIKSETRLKQLSKHAYTHTHTHTHTHIKLNHWAVHLKLTQQCKSNTHQF